MCPSLLAPVWLRVLYLFLRLPKFISLDAQNANEFSSESVHVVSVTVILLLLLLLLQITNFIECTYTPMLIYVHFALSLSLSLSSFLFLLRVTVLVSFVWTFFCVPTRVYINKHMHGLYFYLESVWEHFGCALGICTLYTLFLYSIHHNRTPCDVYLETVFLFSLTSFHNNLFKYLRNYFI